jgi:hypothetical protein
MGMILVQTEAELVRRKDEEEKEKWRRKRRK